MEQILIVSSSDQSRAFLEGFVKNGFTQDIACAPSSSAARRLLLERDYEAVVINAPLKDELGSDLAIHAAESTSSGVVLIVKSEIEEEISEKVSLYGVITISKPISRPFLAQSLRLACASHARVASLRRQAALLESKIEEIRTVDKAKCALIQYLGMSEKEAHRFIEKQAMDKRMPKRSIAEDIIGRYEI
jgi:response regulator NasT